MKDDLDERLDKIAMVLSAARDLYDSSKVMMRQRYNLTETHWENLQNAVNRFDAAKQRVNL